MRRYFRQQREQYFKVFSQFKYRYAALLVQIMENGPANHLEVMQLQRLYAHSAGHLNGLDHIGESFTRNAKNNMSTQL